MLIKQIKNNRFPLLILLILTVVLFLTGCSSVNNNGKHIKTLFKSDTVKITSYTDDGNALAQLTGKKFTITADQKIDSHTSTDEPAIKMHLDDQIWHHSGNTFIAASQNLTNELAVHPDMVKILTDNPNAIMINDYLKLYKNYFKQFKNILIVTTNSGVPIGLYGFNKLKTTSDSNDLSSSASFKLDNQPIFIYRSGYLIMKVKTILQNKNTKPVFKKPVTVK